MINIKKYPYRTPEKNANPYITAGANKSAARKMSSSSNKIRMLRPLDLSEKT
jgi:hypothetical protein